MASAVASTEKIRSWVEHTLETDQLEAHLGTHIKKGEGSSGY